MSDETYQQPPQGLDDDDRIGFARFRADGEDVLMRPHPADTEFTLLRLGSQAAAKLQPSDRREVAERAALALEQLQDIPLEDLRKANLQVILPGSDEKRRAMYAAHAAQEFLPSGSRADTPTPFIPQDVLGTLATQDGGGISIILAQTLDGNMQILFMLPNNSVRGYDLATLARGAIAMQPPPPVEK